MAERKLTAFEEYLAIQEAAKREALQENPVFQRVFLRSRTQSTTVRPFFTPTVPQLDPFVTPERGELNTAGPSNQDFNSSNDDPFHKALDRTLVKTLQFPSSSGEDEEGKGTILAAKHLQPHRVLQAVQQVTAVPEEIQEEVYPPQPDIIQPQILQLQSTGLLDQDILNMNAGNNLQVGGDGQGGVADPLAVVQALLQQGLQASQQAARQVQLMHNQRPVTMAQDYSTQFSGDGDTN